MSEFNDDLNPEEDLPQDTDINEDAAYGEYIQNLMLQEELFGNQPMQFRDAPELWNDPQLPQRVPNGADSEEPTDPEDPDESLTLFNTVLTPVFIARVASSSPTVYPMLYQEQVLVSGVPTDMPGGRSCTNNASGAPAFTIDGIGGWGSGQRGFILSRMNNGLTGMDYLFSPIIPTQPSGSSTFVLTSTGGILKWIQTGSC